MDMIMSEFKQWKRDVRLAWRVYGYIRRAYKWKLDTNNNQFELEWRSGPRQTDLQRVAEHRADQGLQTKM